MTPRPRLLAKRQVTIALCLILACVSVAVICTATAKASFYQMVLCAANNGSNGFQVSTNTTSPQNPAGIFSVENYCGPAPFPAGSNAFLRIVETQPSGNAGNTAYASASWTAPPGISIVAGGGYTRQPGNFNDGWRARFWAEDHGGGGPHNILMQGSGVSGGGIFWGTCSTFCSHLWPFPSWGSYRRFVYEMTCVRPSGCDRAGWNGTDANTFILTLDDPTPSQVWLTNGSPMMSGGWVKGTQNATYAWTEQGSGIRFERVYVDGGERWGIDHIAAGQCNRDAWAGVGEFARVFQPCPGAANLGRAFALNTATLGDGPHTITACTQDYAQWQGIAGTGGQTCASGTIRTDNSAPGAPTGLKIVSANPARYLNRFGAEFGLPPNNGSPITKVHYQVIDAGGQVVKATQTLAATNPTEVAEIQGPAVAGAYRLRVWLEDQVGHVGAPTVADIPRDTTPPAAPQALSVTSPVRSRVEDGFDLRWRNVPDNGSPITKVHYQVLGADGSVIVPEQTSEGENVQAIQSLETPRDRGEYTLRAWLEDAEGNVGVPTTAPLAFQCVRSPAPGGSVLSAELGSSGSLEEVVPQDRGSVLRGRLTDGANGIVRSTVCVFSRVVTRGQREFLGLALSDSDGTYEFPVPAGPSRELTAVYRGGAREISSRATIQTRVRPFIKLRRKVVYNKTYAKFHGSIPGPDNDRVVIVLQVRRGKGWLAFRRYRTRSDGRFTLRYRFSRTTAPTKFVMRAQVRAQAGYPYLQGNSKRLKLIVRPKPRGRGARASGASRGEFPSAEPRNPSPSGGSGTDTGRGSSPPSRGGACPGVGFCG